VASSLQFFFVSLLSAWQVDALPVTGKHWSGEWSQFQRQLKKIVVPSQILVPRLNGFDTKNKNY
jgi:hypothetical protein